MSKNFFSIIVDACNQEEWIERCLNTCLTQRFDNYEVLMSDAISDDKTFEIAKEYEKNFSHFKVYQHNERLPQIWNIKWLTELSKPDSIIVSVDGDDWLKNNKVLKKLNDVYTNDVWMTYGTYEEYPYRDVSDIYVKYPDDVVKNNKFREHRWLASHLRTYRRELFLKIKDSDFKLPNGKWLDTAGDQAFMLPMLEMAGEKSRHIPEVLYIYNVANTLRDGTVNAPRQEEVAKYVRSLPKYSKIKNL